MQISIKSARSEHRKEAVIEFFCLRLLHLAGSAWKLSCKNRPQDFQSGNSVTESTVAIGLWGREQQNRMDQETQKKKEAIPIFEFGHPCCKLPSTESVRRHVSLALSKTLGCKDQSNPMPAFHVTLQHKQSITRLRLFFCSLQQQQYHHIHTRSLYLQSEI
jgi:hypothetical protein